MEAVPAMPATPADDEGFTAAEPTGGAVKLERATAQKAEDGGTPLETITVNCESK
ncbi:hypothetical protein ACGFNP_58940 [Nonomuraea sp. NPDC049269]|uniref:hypothetical protein n=1 Tax=Nonomuraea sp. NPDC049269 TaxID=3364349 RepID=UPI00371D7A37